MEIKTSSILGTQHEGEIAVEFAGSYIQIYIFWYSRYCRLQKKTAWGGGGSPTMNPVHNPGRYAEEAITHFIRLSINIIENPRKIVFLLRMSSVPLSSNL